MANPIEFYTDEHVSKAVVRGLRQRGVNVLTVADAGLRYASDEEHLERWKIIRRLTLIYQVLEKDDVIGHVEHF